jgi:hypothetical protein
VTKKTIEAGANGVTLAVGSPGVAREGPGTWQESRGSGPGLVRDPVFSSPQCRMLQKLVHDGPPSHASPKLVSTRPSPQRGARAQLVVHTLLP